ncbi:MAG TPA: hypothetical protein DIC35_00195, partial [Candidatus Moranbacteria bacterium]|nr:hypothetical protein [Candidatus Moranbacteria bacterium]
MQIFKFTHNAPKNILALGAESAGNFCVFAENRIYFSQDFGDLLIDENYRKFKSELNKFIKKGGFQPDVILTDLHPEMKTTLLGKEISKKYKAEFIQIQHHHAHIFSAIGEYLLQNKSSHKLPATCLTSRQVNYQPDILYGLAMDGTGFGEDEKIWGGEVFRITNEKLQISDQIQNPKSKIRRIGHLENQILLGGELAIREPARMIISILSKFLPKKEVYVFVKKYYSRNEFELLYNQLEQNFNCVETSSTGRILDAVSLLLGFCGNERKYKHEPIDLLEKNSTTPYTDLKLNIIKKSVTTNYKLQTTKLFKYLIKNMTKDRHRLAATAQLYLAQGLYEI